MVTWLDRIVGYLPLKDISTRNDESLKEKKHFGARVAHAYSTEFTGLSKYERE